MTVAAIPVPKHEAREFGVIESDDDGRDHRLPREGRRAADHARRRPALPRVDGQLRVRHGDADRRRDAARARPTPTSAATSSRRSPAPAWPTCTTSRRTIVPGQDDRERGYWRDVGTIDSYFAANMDLIAPLPAFNLYNDEWPVYTYRGAEPPAKVSRGPGYEPSFVDGSLLCQGSIVSGAHVERSIISTGCYVSHDAHVTDSILFPGVRVGPGARLHRCIIDKNVIVPDWYRIGLDARRRPRPVHGQRQRHHRHRQGTTTLLTPPPAPAVGGPKISTSKIVQNCTISRPRIFASAVLAILGREIVQKRSKMLVEIFSLRAGVSGRRGRRRRGRRARCRRGRRPRS